MDEVVVDEEGRMCVEREREWARVRREESVSTLSANRSSYPPVEIVSSVFSNYG